MGSFSGVPRVAALSFATMLSFVAVGSGPAIAQNEPLPPSPLLAQHAAIDFNLPAQPLGTALTAFGRQTGIQVLVDSASVSGRTSTAISGAMTAPQALQQLLGGTGVPHRFTSPTAVTVGSGGPAGSGALQLDPVQVQGVFPVPSQAMIDNLPPAYAGGQVATGGQLGLLGNRDVMSTPFNQTSYTAKKVQDQQAKTVREALIDDPSVRASTPSGSLAAENVYIRGFVSGSDQVTYGGLFGMAPTFSSMPEFAERVEVLKGPSAMLNGMPSSIGGTVNLVPKRAPDAGLTQLTANYVSSAQFGAHADVAMAMAMVNKLLVERTRAVSTASTPATAATATASASASAPAPAVGAAPSLSGRKRHYFEAFPVGANGIAAAAPVTAPVAASGLAAPEPHPIVNSGALGALLSSVVGDEFDAASASASASVYDRMAMPALREEAKRLGVAISKSKPELTAQLKLHGTDSVLYCLCAFPPSHTPVVCRRART